MWIGEVDVPQPVLDAAEAGTLVLFVGAGASRAEPSNLPDFAQLVRDIGARAGRLPTDDEIKQPDVFLGSLEDSQIDVHQLVATAIDLTGSRPNQLHTSIVKLASVCQVPRIVTTNYDRHLTSAARAEGVELEIYEAPALPLGDDFEGIVHLHGSLDQPSRRLVVTDADFGKAYLREAGAARFLERMFAKFTVLFIGYSHGDVVMQYLARALGPRQSRYVLTDDADNAEWRRLGLSPVAYPNGAGDHSALPAAMDRWGALATMGHIEHRARVGDLVAGEPPAIPEEVSYIEAVLSHPQRVRYFQEKASFADVDLGRRWFTWLEGREAFGRLFLEQTSGDPAARTLMAWVADRYITNESMSSLALRAFREKAWPRETWFEIVHCLFALDGEIPSWLAPWLQLALQQAPNRRVDLLDMLLSSKDWSGNFDLALMLFEDRTRPYIRPAPSFGASNERPRFDVILCGDEYWLTDAWTKVFVPVLGGHLDDLLSLITEQITRLYRTLRGLDPSNTFDPIAFSRSAIERHEQDDHRDAVDVLIDAARDCIEAALAEDPALGAHYLSRWASASDDVLRRLAVHGWRLRTDIGPNERLIWLREQGWLWDLSLQHEVFLLIRESLPGASEEVGRWLVEAAVAGPPQEDDEEPSPYRSYNLLGWLAESAPALQHATAAFEQAQAEHPEYGRREHPDLNMYGEAGVVEDALPFTADELHDLVVADPTDALARLRSFQTDHFALKGPTWRGALRSLQACVASYPEDGVTLARALDDADSDVRPSLIYGWDRANLTDTLAAEVLEVIAGWTSDEVLRAVCAMLSNGGTPEHPTAWHQLAPARALASELWPTAPVTGAITSGADLVMEAINHPAGDLAEFWTKAVQWDWSEHQATWDGIPGDLKVEINRMISTPDRSGLLAQTLLAAQLHFFFGADRAWTESNLLPLFDWSAPSVAEAAWQGFLTWGRWNDALLQVGLLNAFLVTTKHAEQLPNKLQHRLAGHLAAVAMHAPEDPATWLTRFVADSPEDLRIAWAQQVQRTLTDLDADATLHQWNRWIARYWADRVQSVPLPLTPPEATAMATWVVALPGVRTEAIDLVLASPAQLGQHDRLLHLLEDVDVAAEATDWCRLIAHLLKNTTDQQWVLGHHLQKIVPSLRQGAPPPDLTDLINEAMRLGVTNAADF